jgi:hypothetical protein
MAIGGRDVTVEIDEAAISLFCREDAAVLHDLQGRAERVTQQGKANAPVSPNGSHGRPSGYGRSQIQYHLGADSESAYADVTTPAQSPEGFPYMAFHEVTDLPHLVPALDAIAG